MPPAAPAAVEIARIDVAGGVACVFCEIGEWRGCAVVLRGVGVGTKGRTGLELEEADWA